MKELSSQLGSQQELSFLRGPNTRYDPNNNILELTFSNKFLQFCFYLSANGWIFSLLQSKAGLVEGRSCLFESLVVFVRFCPTVDHLCRVKDRSDFLVDNGRTFRALRLFGRRLSKWLVAFDVLSFLLCCNVLMNRIFVGLLCYCFYYNLQFFTSLKILQSPPKDYLRPKRTNY